MKTETGTATRGRLFVVAALVVIAVLAVAPVAAFAQNVDATDAQYKTSKEQVAGGASGGGDGGGGLSSSVGGLPFTGVDLLIVAGAGAALLGTGVLLRRLSGPGAPTS
jgi:hypothetical protein